MKRRFFLIAASVSSIALTNCGIDASSHYDQREKTFGKERVEPAPLDSGSEGDIPSATPTPPAPPILTPPPTIEPTPTPEEPPATSGHDTLSQFGLTGYFENDSLTRIIRGSGSDGQFENSSVYDGALQRLFAYMNSDESTEVLDLLTREDGKGRHLVTQTALTNNGDRIAKIKGKESQSGTQKLYWVLGSEDRVRECPNTFICVDRITWTPILGRSATYCFKDLASKQPVVVPYSPNPQFSPDAFKASIPGNRFQSKPFLMTKHDGIVDCKDPDIVTVDLRAYQWQISIGDLGAARKPGFLRKALFKPLAPDSELSVEIRPFDPTRNRTYQPNRGPFIDEVSRFNTKIHYYMSSSNRSFVKVTRTIQTSFEKPFRQWLDNVASTYEGSFLYIPVVMAINSLKALIPVDDSTIGLQVEYTHEFCTHKSNVEHAFNHCTGKVSR